MALSVIVESFPGQGFDSWRKCSVQILEKVDGIFLILKKMVDIKKF